MPRMPLVVTVLLVVGACTSGPSPTGTPESFSLAPGTGSPAVATPTASAAPVAVSTEPAPSQSSSPMSHGPVGLVNDLLALGIDAEQASEFAADPLSRLGVQLCVAGEPVHVYVYGTQQEAVAAGRQIDPDDPSNLGTSIIEWAGEPKFWHRDRILVLYLGTDAEVEAALVSVLGEPFAQGEGRPPLRGGEDC